MDIKIPGFILKTSNGTYIHSICEMPEYGYMTVCKHDIVATTPADFDPVAAEVSMLNQKIDELDAQHNYAVKQIRDRLANLLCLDYTPA